jgi:hypothetical protein
MNGRSMSSILDRTDAHRATRVASIGGDDLGFSCGCDPDRERLPKISRCKLASVAVDGDSEDWSERKGPSAAAIAKTLAHRKAIDPAPPRKRHKFAALAGSGKPGPVETAVVELRPGTISAIDDEKVFGHAPWSGSRRRPSAGAGGAVAAERGPART